MDEEALSMMQSFIEKCKSEDFYMYISNEFYNLKDFSSQVKYLDSYASNQGALDCNYYKNRYKDILPYDKCRVTLDEAENAEGSNYINASFINGLDVYSYIAAQAPLKSTVYDFMRMLCEYNITVLICACNEYEGHKPKCHRYWPNDLDEVLNFDKIEVKLISSEIDSSNEFIKRDLLLKQTCVVNGEEIIKEHNVTQLHIVNWPDHGILENIESIIKMLYIAQDTIKTNQNLNNKNIHDNKQYMLVHCSAGCGRTGTIIALDYSLNLIKSNRIDENFSPFKIAKTLREQRIAMIQTFDQYKMFYEALEYLFNKILSETNQASSDTIKDNEYYNSEQYENNDINNNSSKKPNNVNQNKRNNLIKSVKNFFTKNSSTNVNKLRSSNSASSIRGDKFDKKYENDDYNRNENTFNDNENSINKFNENSIENFEFKPIPAEKFNKFEIDYNNNNTKQQQYQLPNLQNNNYATTIIVNNETNTALLSSNVGSAAEAIFGDNESDTNTNSKSGRLNRTSLKLKINKTATDDKNLIANYECHLARPSSLKSSAGVIQSHSPSYSDLKIKPMQAKLSESLNFDGITNINSNTSHVNDSPPMSARSNYEYQSENKEKFFNLQKFTPVAALRPATASATNITVVETSTNSAPTPPPRKGKTRNKNLSLNLKNNNHVNNNDDVNINNDHSNKTPTGDKQQQYYYYEGN